MREEVEWLRSGAGVEWLRKGGCEVGCENEACGAIRGAAVGAADWKGWSDGDGDKVGVWFRFAVGWRQFHGGIIFTS